MKIIFIIAFFLYGFHLVYAQDLPRIIKQRAKDKLIYKSGDTVERGIDTTFSKTGHVIGNVLSKGEKKSVKNSNGGNPPDTKVADKSTTPAEQNTANRNSPVKNKVSSDFIPGEHIIFEDHFEQDAMGDFPAKWNTNGTGKLVSVEALPGKWLELAHNSAINPMIKEALPENCTIEFDLLLQTDGQRSTPFIQFGLTNVKDILREDMFYKDRFFINLHRYNEEDGKTVEYGIRNDVLGNKNDFPLTSYANQLLHVAIALNKKRIRIYLDDKKIIDLPTAIDAGMRNNFFINNNAIIPASEIGLLVSNIRIATAETDARSLLIKQLMEEGRAVTNAILFDVNSEVIKPSSYSVINQFGDALQKNPALKINIIGHTDNDGTDAANLLLSQKRSLAVKNYIIENYPVAGARIKTEGKGEGQPVADNTSLAGKAKNRRVEFVKL